MSTKKKIAELTEKGLAPKEIAEKLGLRPQTVYTYRSILNRKNKEAERVAEKQKVKVTEDKESEEQVDTTNTIDGRVPELKKEIAKLKDENANLKADAIGASKKIEELREEINRLTERLNSTNYALKLDREMLENERRRYEDLEQAYTYERESHRALLTYIEILSKWTNESEGE